MPSLRELQQRFAAAVLAPDGTAPGFAIAGPARGANRPGPAHAAEFEQPAHAADLEGPARAADPPGPANAAERIAIYRNAVFANYRNALRASFPVVLRLVGEPFFNAAVDAFVHARPSVSGDLNVYGDAFGDFLAGYPHAVDLPYLADVARLEWAVDGAQRAADSVATSGHVLAALARTAPERLPALRLRLDPSCRLVASAFPILRIWQANQPAHEGDDRVSLDEGADLLVVRRGDEGVVLARIGAGEHAFLAALAAGSPLGAALDAAQRADAAFDLGAALRSNIAAGIIAAVVAD